MAAMSRPFLKMNGLGNDFVVVEARSAPFHPGEAEARAIADRASGVGCDQIIGIEPSQKADAFMRIWNADGGEVGACGNATRCAAWLLMEEKARDAATIETEAGLLKAWRAGPMQVSVDMGAPRLDWRQIPLSEELDTRRLELEIGPRGAPILHTPGAVSMGNPHCVFFVADLAAINIPAIGPMVENHPLFPERVNVGFAQILSRDRVRLRVWERGAGLTLACGTGACAAVVAGIRLGLLDSLVDVDTRGGRLTIEWQGLAPQGAGLQSPVRMTGPAQTVFEGEIELPQQ